MHVALRTSFAASRKEPLAEVLERVHAAIVAAGDGEPTVRFTFTDAPVEGRLSSVERVLKRLPQFAPFARTMTPQPGGHAAKVITNVSKTGTTGEQVDFAALLEVARGVPRSFPFHGIAIRFSIPSLPERVDLPALRRMLVSGVEVTDSWWVNGRQRSMSALTIVATEEGAKKLPPVPVRVAAMLAACGKMRKTTPLPVSMMQPPTPDNADVIERIRGVQRDFRTRMPEIVARAEMPHDLAPPAEARAATDEYRSGPRKPELDRLFLPLGYDCRGGSGTFTLQRHTAGNLTVELYLDVGTWSNQVSAIFSVQGLGNGAAFRAALPLPVAPRANAGQYPIGGPERWRQIVENLAALVRELDGSFVPAVEAISGPSPEWYNRPAG